jgi:NitT/TauT family transport system ATP-binding protein
VYTSSGFSPPGGLMTNSTETAITVHGVRKEFRDSAAALSGISFEVRSGQIVGLFGPSGCGKTTLLRIIAGVLESDAGDVLVFGKPARQHRGSVAYVPQRGNLLDWRTLRDNALLGWSIARRNHDSREDIDKRVSDLFVCFGLSEIGDKYPRQCSGGQRQRAALVRGLLTPAPILALDEPSAAIDHITRLRIYETLGTVMEARAKNNSPMTVVIVSHDPEELLLLCDQVIVIPRSGASEVKTVPVTFQRPRSSEIRYDAGFVALKRQLWESLQ